jgi:nonribosomal peptide synthetase protein VioO
VRLVIIGGEAANPARLRDWSALDTGHARLLNTYGCTETTLITHAIELPSPDGTVPLGFALPHVVERLDSSSGGEGGELLIGGPSVAAGYRNRESDRFIELDGQRFFRTGDRVRRRADGALLPAGRVDAEVKIRGIRVDPSEVEAHIGGHPGVRAVAVSGVRVADHTSLIAYVVAQPPTVANGLPAQHRPTTCAPGCRPHLIPSRSPSSPTSSTPPAARSTAAPPPTATKPKETSP